MEPEFADESDLEGEVSEGESPAYRNDLAERLLEFSARIIRVCKAMENSSTGRTLGKQLLRSGTSAGANYEEAQGAQSPADFIHKLHIVFKESRESRYWLRLVQRAQLIDSNRLQPLIDESEELCRIIGKSLVTAKKRNHRLDG